MQTVVETSGYLSDAKHAGLDQDDRDRVIDFISRNPSSGDVIQGSNGARKVRIARRNSGKSGGFRILSAYFGEEFPVVLLAVYSKNERANISKSDLQVLSTLLVDLKSGIRRERSRK
jgi:hypothetical protein